MHPTHTTLAACSSYSFPGFIINSQELSSKSWERMSSRCMLVALVPSIHPQSRECRHQITSLVACWRHSFPGLLRNSWEFCTNSWECMRHTAHCTLTRSRYLVPRRQIPGNSSHNAGNSFPGFRRNTSLSWESLQNTINPSILVPRKQSYYQEFGQIAGNMGPRRQVSQDTMKIVPRNLIFGRLIPGNHRIPGN